MSPTLTSLTALSLVFSVLGAAGCSSTRTETRTDPNPATPDAEVTDPPVDEPDAAPGPRSLVTNTPKAKVVDSSSPALPGMVLVSSNFLQFPSGNQYYREWYAEIENRGTVTICQLRVTATFSAASGAKIGEFVTSADAAAFKQGSSPLTSACIAPGASGVFWTNAFAPSFIEEEKVATIDLSMNGTYDEEATPHPHTPKLSSVKIGNGSSMSGTAIATDTIYNIGLDFYTQDAKGLIFDRLSDVHLETLYKGASWSFSTTIADAAFKTYVPTMEFIDGANPDLASPTTEAGRRGAERLELHRRRMENRAAFVATRR